MKWFKKVKDIIIEDPIQEEALCTCLYDTIINESDRCMINIENTHQHYSTLSLDFVRQLRRFSRHDDNEFINEMYVRLALLTNEELQFDGKTYFRIFRIVMYDNTILDLNKLRDLIDITIWSNGYSNIYDAEYMMYWKGKPIGTNQCPPRISTVIDRIIENSNGITDEKFLSLSKDLQIGLNTHSFNHTTFRSESIKKALELYTKVLKCEGKIMNGMIQK